jgi:hypothetical protein
MDIQIEGYRASDSYFTFAEREKFDPADVVAVLRNEILGVIFRSVIDIDIRSKLGQRFWDNPKTKRREDAPAYFLGTYSFDKSIQTYLDESNDVRSSIAALLDAEASSPLVWFRNGLVHELEPQGISLRVAELDGQQACLALMRSWSADGMFSLSPHEDLAQCLDPRQAGFDAQRVPNYEVCSVNMCLANDGGGRLVLWNVRPDDASRKRLGIEFTGFPYPVPCLAGFDELHVDVRPGDVYVFNGAYVHAVEAAQGRRTNIAFFMGFYDAQTVITWT